MCSCHKQSSSDTNDKNFDTISFNTIAKEDFPGQNPLNVPVETDYDNIKVELENNIYPLNFDKIKYTITDKNVGKGFYYYYIPFLEKQKDDKWIRLSYTPPETQYEEAWYFCAVEGNTTEPNSTTQYLIAKYINEDLTTGKYRLVLFVGPNEYTAEFELK